MRPLSFTKGIFVGAGAVIGLAILLFLSLPHLYLWTENANFESLREKSTLDCATMPLHCLVRDNDLEGVAQYARSERNMELKDHWGRSALFWALYNQQEAAVSALLGLGADPNTKDQNGFTPLYQAVAWGRYNLATELLAHGANINAFNGARYPAPILHYCVMKNMPECVRYLIDAGADLSLEDSFGYTVFERVQTHAHIAPEIGELLTK